MNDLYVLLGWFLFNGGWIVCLVSVLLSPPFIIMGPAVVFLFVSIKNDNDNREAWRLQKIADTVVVCRNAHCQGLQHCPDGCEHSEPHICQNNSCMERPNARCVPASLYGYDSTKFVATAKIVSDLPTANDGQGEGIKDKRTTDGTKEAKND